MPEAQEYRPHHRGLPPLSAWGHRPLLFRVAPEVPVICEGGVNLPLNFSRPTAFESELFVGEALFRVRNVQGAANDPWATGKQYHGKKRLMAFVVQGKFKQRLTFADVKNGFECHRPLQVNWFAKPALQACLTACKYVQPGLESNITGPHPYVRNFLAASADTFTVTTPGEKPPEIMGGEPPEIGYWPDKKARRTALKSEACRREHIFDPANTYTFGFHSDKMMFLDFKAKLPLGRDLDMSHYLSGQPFPFLAKTGDGRALWKFELWHETLLSKAGDVMDTNRLGMGVLSRKISRHASMTEQSTAILKRSSSYRTRKDAESEESESDEDVQELRYRLKDLQREQLILRMRMNSMLRAGGGETTIKTAAHKEFSDAVMRAVDDATEKMRDGRSKPFESTETTRFLQLLHECSTQSNGRPST
eukprot:TRINITY_DN37035_c0_g1_i1.p1 TRINITY_DN37035_c0_g1~~TRINITY_DN37035_c0_g1_i1.p1  ORF type:complete len:433 (+),score=97.27 TRINITY_DN37035_c0_g1_i1:42-1301(+)